MPIVLAAPVTDPWIPLTLQPRPMSWRGFDGSSWALTGSQASNPRLGRGVKGLHMPPVQVHTSSTPLVPGADVLGYSLLERPVYWPLLFRAQDAQQWQDEHAAFFDSFHPVQHGQWSVGEGDDTRTIELRGDFDGSHIFDRDPFVSGWALIGVQLVASRPLWRGKTIRKSFSAPGGADFIPEGGAPTFHITRSRTYGAASIKNPGNEPAYLRWTVKGPHPEHVLLGVAGGIIDVPFAIPDGQTLVIDTDPAGQYATVDGVDVAAALGFQVFAPVPARGESPLTITTAGTGEVAAELTPLYWRAF